jgi:hypothetical protein
MPGEGLGRSRVPGGPITRPPTAWPAVAVVGVPEIRGGRQPRPPGESARRAYRPLIGQEHAVGGMRESGVEPDVLDTGQVTVNLAPAPTRLPRGATRWARTPPDPSVLPSADVE